jgi:hypothetical protein
VDFGCGEETVAMVVGPVQRDRCCEGDEELLKRYKGLDGDESVAQFWPGVGLVMASFLEVMGSDV